MAGNPQKEMLKLVGKLNHLIPNAAITVNDLNNLKASKFQGICIGFLRTLCAAPYNALQRQNNQMSMIGYREMFSNTLVVVNMYHCINYVLRKIGVTDFTLYDLTEPSPKTTKYTAAMVDFLDYCDNKISDGIGELKSIKLKKDTIDYLLKKIDSVQNEINKNAANRVARSQEKKNLKEYLNKNKQILEVLMNDRENAKKSRRNVPMPDTMRRFKSQLNFDRLSVTPLPQRAKGTIHGSWQSEGGNSIGLKSVKKDSRPTDKYFLDAETEKVLTFIRENINDGEINLNLEKNSINKLAVLVNSLVSIHGLRITSFVPEEIIKCANVLQYRGKMDKNMLQTVNAPHTWPLFLLFLSWLVDLYNVTKVFNPYEALYPEIGNVDIASEEIYNQIPLWLPYLIEGYALHRNGKDDMPEMQKFFEEYKKKLNINEEEIVNLQQKHNTYLVELNNSEDAADVQELMEQCEKFTKDINEIKQYIYNSEQYVQQLEEKLPKVYRKY